MSDESVTKKELSKDVLEALGMGSDKTSAKLTWSEVSEVVVDKDGIELKMEPSKEGGEEDDEKKEPTAKNPIVENEISSLKAEMAELKTMFENFAKSMKPKEEEEEPPKEEKAKVKDEKKEEPDEEEKAEAKAPQKTAGSEAFSNIGLRELGQLLAKSREG